MVAAAAMVFIPVVQHILNEIQLQHSFFPIFTVKYCENKEWEKVPTSKVNKLAGGILYMFFQIVLGDGI